MSSMLVLIILYTVCIHTNAVSWLPIDGVDDGEFYVSAHSFKEAYVPLPLDMKNVCGVTFYVAVADQTWTTVKDISLTTYEDEDEDENEDETDEIVSYIDITIKHPNLHEGQQSVMLSIDRYNELKETSMCFVTCDNTGGNSLNLQVGTNSTKTKRVKIIVEKKLACQNIKESSFSLPHYHSTYFIIAALVIVIIFTIALLLSQKGGSRKKRELHYIREPLICGKSTGKMGQSPSKTNWAELIKRLKDQKVKSKNHPNAPAKQLLTHGNKPKTRVMVLSMDKQSDEKLLNDVIKNGAQKKGDKDQTQKVEAHQALAGDVLISKELTESDDGNVFYEAANIVVPEQEPVIRTFSVVSTERGVKEDLKKLLKENKASISNDPNIQKVLIISGSHGNRREDGKGNIDPVGGKSGLSDDSYLNNSFYREVCHSIGIQANASHFVENSSGDFVKWKTPIFTRPDVRTVTPCATQPHGSHLRADGVFSELIVKNELRSITGDPHAKLNSSQRDVLREMCQDSVKHIVLAGPSGAGKTVMLCERAKKEAAKLKKEHPEATVEIHVVSCMAVSESAELYTLWNTKHFKVKYWTREQLCAELGLNIKDYGVDKSLEFIIAACNAKDTANKVHEKNGGGQLISVFMFDEAFKKPTKDENVQDWTDKQLCAELGLNIKDYGVDKCIEFIIATSTAKDTANKVQEKNGGGQLISVFMVDEAVTKPAEDEKVHDWTELGQLESLSTVRTITCVQPSSGAGSSGQYTVKLPSSSDARHQPTSFYSRLLNVGYRNSNNFFVDHDFKVGTHTPSSPAGTKGVVWIQCSSTEDLGKAVRKAVGDCDTVMLYWDRKGEDVCKVAAEASTATSVVDLVDYAGCEHTHVIFISNYGMVLEATTRAREKLVMVTGPGLLSDSNHILSEAAASGHEYKRFSEDVRCIEDPCEWSGNCADGFPLLEHKLFCATQDCGHMFGAKEDKCPKCGLGNLVGGK